ncbi:MAG: ABC-F family ATP-binding cassette domain-containing protein [Clostridium sp.]|nr:ABC-F family ATP-binding cassette domain-containing protein [Clostridium sp.]
MAVLSVSQISKSYGAATVLQQIDFQLYRAERVGLVGPNGAGKTTLLKIIAGQEMADTGTVALARDVTIGYLEQGTAKAAAGTMEEELRRAFAPLDELAVRMSLLEKNMASAKLAADSQALEAVLNDYGKLRHRFEEAGGYSAESRLRSVVSGLGFSASDLKRAMETFSGGEKTRLRLARILLEEPGLLLLDEPTNHLDLAAVEWLERYLSEWRGCVLIVSHDRYFLDRVAGRILSLERQQLKSYRGNYSAYTAQRELAAVTEEKAYRKQQDYISKEETFVRTQGTGEREKKQAKSRQKKLEKLTKLDSPQQARAMALDFHFSGRSGEIAVRLSNVAKEFGARTVFRDVNVEIRWGKRVALLGANGSGKSTLLKLIAGELTADNGTVWLGPSVRLVYFDQHQQAVSADKTPLAEIMDASGMTLGAARTYLGRFLFSGEDVFKCNADLSGGERSRLALAKLSLDAGNFLVLDEPTNHLDISGVEELESALDAFCGTLLVVSHDRYFISRTTDSVLEVKDGSVSFYQMPYADYLLERERREKASVSSEKADLRERQETEKQRREDLLAKRRELRKMELRIRETEEEIGRLEHRLALLEAELSEPDVFNDYRLAAEKGEEMERVKEGLEKLYSLWEELTCHLEEGL